MAATLKEQAEAFALELNLLMSKVFGSGKNKFSVLTQDGTNRASIATWTKVDEIDQTAPIIVGFKGRRKTPKIHLYIEFDCDWSSESSYLSVVRSTMSMKIEGNNNPLFRYDFDKQKTGDLPTAYLHVHAHRDEISWLLLQSAANRPKARRRKGKMPLLSEIHFPLGGERFRPCLEDFLEFSILEFGLSVKPTALKALGEGRLRWRHTQLRAAISDYPEIAADAFCKYGWKVESTENSRYSKPKVKTQGI